MRISQRLDYALRALVLLAAQPHGTHTAAGDLADRLGLPRRFVEQQITTLSRAGVVECRRGAAGGCALAKPAAEVTVAEVVFALNGDIIDVPHQAGSATAELWWHASESLGEFLRGVSLEQLAKRQRELDVQAAPMYFI